MSNRRLGMATLVVALGACDDATTAAVLSAPDPDAGSFEQQGQPEALPAAPRRSVAREVSFGGYARDLARAHDGGILVSGYGTDLGTDAWVLHFDPGTATVRSAVYPGAWENRIAVGRHGTLLAAMTIFRLWFAGLDDAGNVLWQQELPIGGNIVGLVAGTGSYHALWWGNSSNSTRDFGLARVAADGSSIEVTVFTAPAEAFGVQQRIFPSGLARLHDDSVVITGVFAEPDAHPFVMRTTQDQILWQIGFRESGLVTAPALGHDGNLCIAGTSWPEVWVAKLRGSDGALLWHTRVAGIPDSFSVTPHLVTATPARGCLVVIGSDTFDPRYAVEDVRTVELSAAGRVQHARRISALGAGMHPFGSVPTQDGLVLGLFDPVAADIALYVPGLAHEARACDRSDVQRGIIGSPLTWTVLHPGLSIESARQRPATTDPHITPIFATHVSRDICPLM